MSPKTEARTSKDELKAHLAAGIPGSLDAILDQHEENLLTGVEDWEAFLALSTELDTPLAEVAEIETHFRNLDSTAPPEFTGDAADIVSSAVKIKEDLTNSLILATLPIEAGIEMDMGMMSSMQSMYDMRYRSIYVSTRNPEMMNEDPLAGEGDNLIESDFEKPAELVLTATDMDRPSFKLRATETALIRSMDQLNASLFKFALSGDANILAIAPWTLITDSPIITTSNRQGDQEYFSVFMDLSDDPLNSESVGNFKAATSKLQAALPNSPFVQIVFHGDMCEYRLDKNALLQGANYQGQRPPLPENSIGLPFHGQVLFQTGFNKVPPFVREPGNIATTLQKLKYETRAYYNTALEVELDKIYNINATYVERERRQIQEEMQAVVRHEILGPFSKVVGASEMLFKALGSTEKLKPELTAALIDRLQAGDITMSELFAMINPDLALLAKERALYSLEVGRVRELLYNMDTASALSDLKILSTGRALERAITAFPKRTISNEHVPQQLTINLNTEGLGHGKGLQQLPPTMGFGKFIELANAIFLNNALDHNAKLPEVEMFINVGIERVPELPGYMFIAVEYTNLGATADDEAQQFLTSGNDNGSQRKGGTRRSLRLIERLVQRQAGVPEEHRHLLFSKGNRPDGKGFSNRYLLTIPQRFHHQFDEEAV